MKKPLSIIENIDCMEGMKKYPDKFFELAIVDPPYGIEDSISKGGNSKSKSVVKFHQMYSEQSKTWDIVPTTEYFNELKRVSKNQIIWGGNYFESLGVCRGFVCWDKVRYVPNFSMVEYAWTSFNTPSKLFKYCNNAGFVLKVEDKKIHPTQKPLKLYKWLLTNYAKEGDKILDTHLGSGSSRIAAYTMGFDFYGFEIDVDYFIAQEKRFKEQIAQGSLFDYGL